MEAYEFADGEVGTQEGGEMSNWREPLMISQAEAAIQQAASLLPDDVAIRTEAGLIARWGCQVRG